MDKEWKAYWLIDQRFYGLSPINVFHKQLAEHTIPKHREDLKNHHMLVRKHVYMTEPVKSSYIDITADDYYKLYINGEFVAQGPSPSYHFYYCYNRHNVSAFLRPGKNVIAVHVYYQGLINRVWNSGDYRQGLIAELFVNDKLHVFTDTTWKYAIATEYSGTSTIGYDTQFTENIDSRLEKKGWKELDFNDSGWENAWINISDDHKLFLQETKSLQISSLMPEKIHKIDNGHFFIDFGHEFTGQFMISAKGSPGQVVEIRCGEELEEGSNYQVKYDMRCNCKYQEYWTLSGEADLLEHFDYKAFRYVEVITAELGVEISGFSAIVRHYPFDSELCGFESSSQLLNDIWGICRNGVKFGTQETILDCPSREKGQYLGDFTISGHSSLYLTNDLDLYRKTLKDFALSAFVCPGLMAVVPGGVMQEIADFSLQWPWQLLTYYMHSGDKHFLREMYPVAQKLLQYFKQFKREDGLLQNVIEKWNIVDWPENLRDNYDFDVSVKVGEGCHNVINAFYCGAVKTVNQIEDMLDIPHSEEFLPLKEAFITAFYNADTNLFTDSAISSHSSLHSNAISLFYDLAPECAHESIIEFIRSKRFNCGVYISYFLLKGLARVGAYDLVYELITSEDEHSWANMLREGATTCFEAWGKDQKWNTSLCHPWASAPISVIIEDIIGLKPGKPGWEEINFSPKLPKTLETISLKITVRTGKISIEHKNGITNISSFKNVKINRS